MARKVILETDYQFNPAESSIYIFDKYIPAERILLVTNLTKGKVIYNFSDPALGYVSLNRLGNVSLELDPLQEAGSPNQIGCELYLKYDCSAMDATDKIQIIVDEYAETVTFEDTLLDGAQKLRVSQPQSLIDTDFEYSIQPSKWETLSLSQNYPSFFAKPGGGNAIAVSSIVGDGATPKSTITITTTIPHGLVVGSIASVQETMNYRAEGTFQVTSVPSIYTFTYIAKGQVTGDVNYQNLSAVYAGDVYEASHIPGGNYPGLGAYGTTGTAANTMNPWFAKSDNAYPFSTVTVTFTNPHGLFPGTPISITGTAGAGIDGDFYVSKVATTRTLQFQLSKQVPNTLTIPTTARIVAKGEGYVIHRPYDAGVALAPTIPNPGVQIIRQTRRYFRYQAGKSVQFSTGAKLTPTYNIDSITLESGAVGTRNVSVVTIEDHGLQVGAVIHVENIKTQDAVNPFNGLFTVTAVPDSNSFKYQVNLTSPVSTHDLKSASPTMNIHAYKWVGAATRCGMFDDQNGFWFEYDGQELYVARRHSEKLLQGRLNLIYGSNQVTGVGTLFREQLVANDMVVIKGATYKVLQVNSDTSLTISPAWRGPSVNGTRGLITILERVAQDEWNLDKCDGTGPSGYVIDITTMQMVYIDYSWYGAGTIRFGVRGNNGKIIYVHRMPMNNINAGAYQKSGNLPARYEVSTEPIQNTRMISGESASRGSTLTPYGTTLYVENVHDWPATGYLWVKDTTNSEIMKYTSIGEYDPVVKGYPLTVLRRQSMTYAYPDRTFTFSGTTDPVSFQADSSFSGVGGDAQVAIQSIEITCVPIIQHWGSSVIEDGGYQTDLLPVFTGGMTKYISVAPGTTRPLVALRCAPSVDNALGRNYGLRELINRMQLAMKAIGVQTNGSFRIDCILNPLQMGYTNWTIANISFTKAAAALTMANGSQTIIVANTDTQGLNGLVVGMGISGTNIPAGTTITSVLGDRFTISAAATGTSSGTYTFTPVAYLPTTSTTQAYNGLPLDWAKDSVAAQSLAQVLYLDNAGPSAGVVPTSGAPSGYVVGGDSVFSFFTENGSGTSYNSSVYDLSGIRELGNSILSGNGTVSTPGYPMGPDILVVTATNIGTTSSNISARLSWTEAQA